MVLANSLHKHKERKVSCVFAAKATRIRIIRLTNIACRLVARWVQRMSLHTVRLAVCSMINDCSAFSEAKKHSLPSNCLPFANFGYYFICLRSKQHNCSLQCTCLPSYWLHKFRASFSVYMYKHVSLSAKLKSPGCANGLLKLRSGWHDSCK